MPSGIRASRKPRKSGTEEQEQNGVTAPRVEAAMLPRPKRDLDMSFWSLFCEIRVLMKAIMETTVKISTRILSES